MNQFKKYWTSLEIQLRQFKNWTITYTRQLPVNKKMSLLKVCFFFNCRVNQMSVEVPFVDPWVRASWRCLCTYSSMFLSLAYLVRWTSSLILLSPQRSCLIRIRKWYEQTSWRIPLNYVLRACMKYVNRTKPPPPPKILLSMILCIINHGLESRNEMWGHA